MSNKVITTTSVKLGIYETSTDSQLAGMVGDKKEFEDGRVFRLCKAGETLVAGILVQAVVSLASDDSIEIATSQAIGDREVNVTADATSEHAVHTLANGYLVMSDTTGDIGTFYKIKDNDALVSGSNGKIYLYNALTTAIVAGTNECSFCVNPYSGVIKDANTAQKVGVPYIAVADGAYFWALCEGYGPATATAAGIAAGDYVYGNAGSVTKSATTAFDTEVRIGVAVTAAASGDAFICKYFRFG